MPTDDATTKLSSVDTLLKDVALSNLQNTKTDITVTDPNPDFLQVSAFCPMRCLMRTATVVWVFTRYSTT